MATPNYGYEKRQKELAKKRKKEDKLKARAERKTGTDADSDAPSPEGGEEAGTTDEIAGTQPGTGAGAAQ